MAMSSKNTVVDTLKDCIHLATFPLSLALKKNNALPHSHRAR